MTLIVGIILFYLIYPQLTPKVTAENLECIYSFMSIYGQKFYTCEIQNTEILTKPQVTYEGLVGKHQPNKTDRDVNSFFIWNAKQVTSISKGIENAIKHVEAIYMGKTSLKEITQNDLKAFADLKMLSLGENKIEDIPADLFKFNPNLKIIYLVENPLKHIDPLVFSNLGNLIALALGKCQNGAVFENADNFVDVRKVVNRIEHGECAGEKAKSGTEATFREDGQI